MCPAGYLGNHAAVPGVNFILRVSDGRENPTFPFQHRSTRIVARSFNGKKNSTRFCVSSSFDGQDVRKVPLAHSCKTNAGESSSRIHTQLCHGSLIFLM